MKLRQDICSYVELIPCMAYVTPVKCMDSRLLAVYICIKLFQCIQSESEAQQDGRLFFLGENL